MLEDEPSHHPAASYLAMTVLVLVENRAMLLLRLCGTNLFSSTLVLASTAIKGPNQPCYKFIPTATAGQVPDDKCQVTAYEQLQERDCTLRRPEVLLTNGTHAATGRADACQRQRLSGGPTQVHS